MLFIDRLVEMIGKATSWLSLLLVIVIIIDVFLRYVFSITSSASFELEWHLFAVIFLLGAAYTLQQDKHVRVDVFYQRFSDKTKAWVNLVGTLFLLLPFCTVACWESISFVQSSFEFRETSPDPGGLPARYLIKAMLPFGFFLLGMQGISEALKSLQRIIGHA
jgi:TRAP-type mannitol/chloroaromatic compound transport system permease small subunit